MNENLFSKSASGNALLELLSQPLYYRNQIATTAVQNVNFFKELSSGSSELVTNIQSAGQIGSPNEFYLQGIAFHPESDTPKADIVKLYNSSFATLYINGREKLTVPTWMIPDPCNLQGAISTTETSTTEHLLANIGNGPFNGSYPLSVPAVVGNKVEMQPIKIDSQENFYIKLGISAGSVFSAAFYAWFVLYGYYGKSR